MDNSEKEPRFRNSINLNWTHGFTPTQKSFLMLLFLTGIDCGTNRFKDPTFLKVPVTSPALKAIV